VSRPLSVLRGHSVPRFEVAIPSSSDWGSQYVPLDSRIRGEVAKCQSIGQADDRAISKNGKTGRGKIRDLEGRLAYCLDTKFNQFDHFTHIVRDWDTDFVQLDRGPFVGKLFQAGDPEWGLLGHGQFNRRLDQRGRSPLFWTFAFPTSRAIHKAYGHDVPHDGVIVYRPGGEIACQSVEGFEVHVLSLPEAVIDSAVRLTGAPDPRESIDTDRSVQSNPRRRAALVRRLIGLRKKLTKDPAMADGGGFRVEMGYELPHLLLESLDLEADDESRPSLRQRELAIRRAGEFIQAFSYRPISVRELCAAARVSERTLRYCFLESFGVSPKKYLQAHRFHRVRRALVQADPARGKIADVAQQWGFFHLSQFAADYRRMFGELPSDTLKRRRVRSYSYGTTQKSTRA